MNGLEAFDKLVATLNIKEKIVENKIHSSWQSAIDTIENDLKVLQILKEKKVDLGLIYYMIFIEPPTKNTLLERYNQLVYLGKETAKVQLTEEELTLIVKWLTELPTAHFTRDVFRENQRSE